MLSKTWLLTSRRDRALLRCASTPTRSACHKLPRPNAPSRAWFTQKLSSRNFAEPIPSYARTPQVPLRQVRDGREREGLCERSRHRQTRGPLQGRTDRNSAPACALPPHPIPTTHPPSRFHMRYHRPNRPASPSSSVDQAPTPGGAERLKATPGCAVRGAGWRWREGVRRECSAVGFCLHAC